MLISFDIGIKNLAYCIFATATATATDPLSIVAWGIINLSDTVSNANVCNCIPKSKQTICGKKAQYMHDTMYCCTIHAKTCGKLLPSKDLTMPYVKKLKMDELATYCAQKFISIGAGDKKQQILDKVQQHLDKNVLQTVKKTVTKTANQIHLVDIGKRIRDNFNATFTQYLDKITHVVLENQISPIAGRMNTIQGMVAQYFIMKSNDLHIDYISSAGKLKGLSSSSEYKDHKKDGIAFCERFMEANPELAKLKQIIIDSPKKDDLADCFLQGIYYLKKQNIINYSEDLKIKSVV